MSYWKAVEMNSEKKRKYTKAKIKLFCYKKTNIYIEKQMCLAGDI